LSLGALNRLHPKDVHLQEAIKAGNAEVWMVKVVVQWVADWWSNHGKTRRPYPCIRGTTNRPRLAERRCCSFSDLGDQSARLG